MDYLLIGLALGVSFALLFGAGAGVNYGLEQRSFRKRICSLNTPEGHRQEAERLIGLSIRTFDKDYERYLRDEAFQHFVHADQLENGPYKH